MTPQSEQEKWKLTPERTAWYNIKQRCYDKNTPAYRNYGARGITMSDKWINNFPAFLAEVGERPGPEYSIDRINNDGNYEPGNVRWATRIEQARNRRLPDSASHYPGVQPKGKRWEATLYIKSEHIYLGRYDTLEQAIEVRQQAEIKYFGSTMVESDVNEAVHTDLTDEILAIVLAGRGNKYFTSLELTRLFERKLDQEKAEARKEALHDLRSIFIPETKQFYTDPVEFIDHELATLTPKTTKEDI